MADGTIVLETDLNTQKLKNKLDKLNNDIERQTSKIKDLQAQYDRAISGEGVTENPAFDRLNKQLEKAKADLTGYEAELQKIHESTDLQLRGAEDAGTVEHVLEVEQVQIDRLNEKFAKQLSEVQRIEEALRQLPKDTEGSNMAAETLRLELERAQIALQRMQTEAQGVEGELNNTQPESGAIRQNLDDAAAALGKFEKRLGTIAKKVFIFTVITAGLRNIKAYMGEALEANNDFQASLASLRGTLRTAFQPILTVIIPMLKTLIDVLNVAFTYIAKFTSWLFGTTVEASSEAAKALYDQSKATKAAGAAAEKAKKQMSGLDEMNTWQSQSSGGGGGGASVPDADFAGLNTALSDKMQKILDVIKNNILEIGAGFLTWKIAKNLTNSLQTTFGLTMSIVGAVKMVKSGLDAWQNGVNWDNFFGMLEGGVAIVIGLAVAFGTLGAVIGLLVAGIAMVVVGIRDWIAQGELTDATFTMISTGILAIGVAIALVVGWPALLVAAIAVAALAIYKYWDEIKQFLIDVFTGIKDFFVSTWEAISLFFSGILDGISQYFSDTWTAISDAAGTFGQGIADAAKSAWKAISGWFKSSVAPKFTLAFWKSKFSTIADGLTSKIKDGINAAIALFNRFINWVNEKMNIRWDALKIAGLTVIPEGSFQLLKLKNIPQLAQGAVIPANREFLAVLGDQKHGTNIEAPEDLIRQIVREESGNGTYTFIAQLDGRTIFKEVIDQGKLSRRMTGKNAFALGGG
nr:MAG TPA: minor tail protein [Caudoviricetes sp.]